VLIGLELQQLDNRTLSRLETAVSKSEYVGQGKKLKVTNKVYFSTPILVSTQLSHVLQVNPDILGGLIVEIGDRTIDLSVSAKIARMNKLLTDTL
jgi:F-type H+-transporting ATPase subunit O